MMESAHATTLIGSRISLISKKDIRYEGTLFTIDPNEATVALQNVRSHGTEGRANGEQVPPSENIFPYVMFRGCDIKDLHVHETPAKKETSTPSKPSSEGRASQPVVSQQAAGIQSSPRPTSGQKNSAPPAVVKNTVPPAPPEPIYTRRQSDPEPQQHSGPRNHHPRLPPRRNRQHASSPQNSSMPGMGNFLQSRRKGKEGPRHEQDLSEEFDFESSNAQFNKEQEMLNLLNLNGDTGGDEGQNQASTSNPVVVARKYDSSSFFDQLSCDALDGKHRLKAAEERHLNTETFGETGVFRPRYYRGGGGSGGRFRGRRGGGRGNFNSYSNNNSGGGYDYSDSFRGGRNSPREHGGRSMGRGRGRSQGQFGQRQGNGRYYS